MEKAIEATLLYIGEHQYMVVNAEPLDRVEIETPCHMVLIEWDAKEKGYCISPQPLAIEECIKIRQQSMTEERLREIEQAREMCKS